MSRLPSNENAYLEQLARLVRERVWTYLTEFSQPHKLAAIAEELFQLPKGDLRRLAAVHLGMADESRLMLAAAERLLRDLPSSAAHSQVELRSSIRRPVSWRETTLRRLQTGDPSLFVCRPTERRYDTHLARLLKAALTNCAQLFELTGLSKRGPTGLSISDLSSRAEHLAHHVKLSDIGSISQVPPHAVQGAYRNPHGRAVVCFLKLYREAVINLAPSVLYQLITRQLLIPSQPDRLLELHVGFELINELGSHGYTKMENRLVTPGTSLPFARMRHAPSGRRITIWYQRALRSVLAEASEGQYRQTLGAAHLRKSSLVPDFIVVSDRPNRLLLVEVKFTSRSDGAPDQAGIKDIFTYLHDSVDVLTDYTKPRGLVVAWSSTALPAVSDVMVVSPKGLSGAIRLTLESWGLPRAG